jgi:precorrin-3B methylase
VIALYNPKSQRRPQHINQAVKILRRCKPDDTPVRADQKRRKSGKRPKARDLASIDYAFLT